MRNIVKTLIAAVILAELAFAGYVLFSKDDRAPVETGARNNSAATPEADPRLSGAHVVAGGITGATPPATGTDGLARAPQPSSAGNVAPDSAPAVQHAAQGPKPAAQPHPQQQPTHPRETAVATNAVAPKAGAVPQPEPGRDGHGGGSKAVSTTATDELVRQSAKLDPALPPPSQPAPNRDGLPRRSPNDVAAAMTDQLVRQSARLDPASQSAKPQSPTPPGAQ
jgi:hypothetical protein